MGEPKAEIEHQGCETDDLGPWAQVYSGAKYYPLNPRAEDILLDDIIHHLSRIGRYNGGTASKRPYTVAQHSVYVMEDVRHRGGTSEECFCGLMHDATEAYMGDLIRPLKRLIPDFERLEEKLFSAIAEKFGMAPEIPEIVRRADNAVLMAEKRRLVPNADPWSIEEPPASWITTFNVWDAKRAEKAFRESFNHCNRRRPKPFLS